MQDTASRVIVASPAARVLAYFIDILVVTPVNLLLALALIPNFEANSLLAESHKSELFYASLIAQVVQAAYATIFVSAFQATLGKMALKLKVRRVDQEPLLPDTALLRAMVVFVGNLIFPIELIASSVLLFADPVRRTVHDRIAHTLVIRIPRDEARP